MKSLNLSLKALILFGFLWTASAFTSRNLWNAKNHKVESNQKDSLFTAHCRCVYDSCELGKKGLSFSVFEKGMIGFYNLKGLGISKKDILSIVDFQKPSTQKRLWVIDIKNFKVLFNTLVAHGRNTGEDEAIQFSDTPNSNMSSLGFYCTSNTYCGKHGLSLVLNGMDKGFNSNAKDRSIVMHGADYVSEEFIQCNGRLGRSHGCPALPVKEHKQIIETVEGGSVLFLHHQSPNFQSIYLNRSKAVDQFLDSDYVAKK